jgi:DNA-binding PadR family transcriptional regulator
MRPIEFEILLTLATGERHGYAVIQAIESARGDGSTVETGTLYRALQRLVEQDFVREKSPSRQTAATDDERKRYYAITPTGRRAASHEAARLAALVDGARAARLI